MNKSRLLSSIGKMLDFYVEKHRVECGCQDFLGEVLDTIVDEYYELKQTVGIEKSRGMTVSLIQAEAKLCAISELIMIIFDWKLSTDHRVMMMDMFRNHSHFDPEDFVKLDMNLDVVNEED